MGSYVCSHGARIAVRTMSSMITPPAAPSGLRRTNRPRLVHAPGGAGRTLTIGTSTRASIGLAAIPDTRIEHAVEHVDQEVGEDHDDGDEHHQRLHDRIVPPQDGL